MPKATSNHGAGPHTSDLELLVRRITNAKLYLCSQNVPGDVKEYFQTKISSLRLSTIIIRDGDRSVTLSLGPGKIVKATVSLGVFNGIFACKKEDPYSVSLFSKKIPKLIKNATISGEIIPNSSNITLDDIIDLFFTIIDLLEFHSLYQLLTKWWMLDAHKTYTPNNIDQMEGTLEFRRKREKHLFDANLKDKIVLDLGCGFGRLIPKFLRKKVAEIIAVDISHDQLRMMSDYLCKSGYSSRKVHRVCSDIRYLPLRSVLCDYIYCISVISHVPNDEKVLKEISRVLKKRGMTYIEFSEKALPAMPQFYMWERRCDKEAIEKLFATAQLQLVEIHKARISKKSIATSFLCVGKRVS